jgi:hypothetical protein
MSNLVYLQFFIFLTTQIVLAQQPIRQPALDRALINLLNEDNAGNRQELDSSLERVDKLASATGDLYWRVQPPPQSQQQPKPQDWIFQRSGPSLRYQRSLAEPFNGESLNAESGFQRFVGGSPMSDSYLSAAVQSTGLVGLDGPAAANSPNYHALVDEFKQYSRMANPSRESRAFKPKLMSTARGFGKRSQQNLKSHSTGSELR